MEVRIGTMDEYVVKEQRQYNAMLPLDGMSVLDIGGNIGAFAVYATDHGANDVTSIEPEPENFKLLLRNTVGRNVRPIPAAVVPHRRGSEKLWVNSGKNKGTHSTVERKGRESVGVSAINFSDLMAANRFDAVKCDIEGGEYSLPWEELSATVKVVAMELHLNRVQWRKVDAPVLVERFLELGFTAVREPRVGEKNWHTLAVWKR